MAETFLSAIERLDNWIDNSGWIGYDPFHGPSAPFARRLIFEVPILRIVLQQSANPRPLLGITKQHSTMATGHFASDYLRLYQVTGRQDYLDKATFCLSDLRENCSRGYAGYAWDNAFDFQNRIWYRKMVHD